MLKYWRVGRRQELRERLCEWKEIGDQGKDLEWLGIERKMVMETGVKVEMGRVWGNKGNGEDGEREKAEDEK